MNKKQFKEKLKDIWWDIKYYTWTKPSNIYYSILWYFKNRITFNKILKEWRPWDSEYQVNLFKFGIQQLCNNIEKYGHEETISRNKKIAAMKQLIAELSRDVEDEVYNAVYGEDTNHFYVDDNGLLNSKLTQEKSNQLHNRFVKLLNKENNKHYDTIFKLIKGQSHKELAKLQEENLQKLTPEEQKKAQKEGYYDVWVKGFDGTGIEGWWD